MQFKDFLTEERTGSLTGLSKWASDREMKFEDLVRMDLVGKNVRPKQLQKKTIYWMKERTTAHHFNYASDTFPVEFLGAGMQKGYKDKVDWLGFNPKVKDLGDDQYYFFKAHGNKKTYMFGAYEWKGSLAIGSGAINVSCYDIKNAEQIPQKEKEMLIQHSLAIAEKMIKAAEEHIMTFNKDFPRYSWVRGKIPKEVWKVVEPELKKRVMKG